MKKYIYTIGLALIPYTTLAVGEKDQVSLGSLKSFIEAVTGIIGKQIVPLLITAGIAIFFYRIVISIYKVGDDPSAVKEGKTLLFWGIIAFFVMVSIWGITAIISNTFGITQVVPQLGDR